MQPWMKTCLQYLELLEVEAARQFKEAETAYDLADAHLNNARQNLYAARNALKYFDELCEHHQKGGAS